MKVLVCEDDATMSFIINHHLKSFGFEPVLVTDVTSAIEKLNVERPDIIITDYILPDLTGLELIDYVGKLSPKPLPGILMSAMELEFLEQQEGIKLENFYLKKPFTAAQLKEKIEFLTAA
jgi:DNA-binding response OmpR family regulator